jgi:hypothetical protein
LHKQEKSKRRNDKQEISGSETVLEKIKKSTPWIFGKKLRRPKIIFPKIKSLKLSLPTPSRSLLIIIVFFTLFLLQTGIVYLIVRDPRSVGADKDGNPVFIYEGSIHDAFVIESIVASILIIVFSFGFILVYQASRYVYNKKIADYYLIIGVFIILISFGLLQFMLYVKAPRLILKPK